MSKASSDQLAHRSHTERTGDSTFLGGPLPVELTLVSEYLRVVRERYPEVFEDLREAAKGDESANAVAGAWIARWHMHAPWAHWVGETTLEMYRGAWKADDDKARALLDELFIAYPVAVWSDPKPLPVGHTVHGWDAGATNSKADYVAAATRAAATIARRQIEEAERSAKAQGLVDRASRREATKHLEWLADWQVGGMTDTEIAIAWLDANERTRSDANVTAVRGAIRQATREMATLIKLERLKRKPGRPRKRPKS